MTKEIKKTQNICKTAYINKQEKTKTHINQINTQFSTRRGV